MRLSSKIIRTKNKKIVQEDKKQDEIKPTHSERARKKKKRLV